MYKKIKCLSFMHNDLGKSLLPYTDLMIDATGVTVTSPRYTTPTLITYTNVWLGMATVDCVEFDDMHIITQQDFDNLVWSECKQSDITTSPTQISVTTDSDGIEFFIERAILFGENVIYRTWVAE
jgi:hypothetical protein